MGVVARSRPRTAPVSYTHLSQGVPERVIADILGHREVATTQAHYIRSDDAQRRAALAVLGPLLPLSLIHI